MSNQLVVVPDSSQDENAVVAQFIEASRELVPSVQISLAKRVLNADGSSKVMCMAARTEAPLNEDEVASVSDLALRLSDGTNMVLSLSFFNDNTPCVGLAGGGFGGGRSTGSSIPFSRSSYDPDRYSVHTVQAESKLAPVLVATVLLAMTGFYCAVGLPINSHLQSIQSTLNALAVSGSAANHSLPPLKSLIAHHSVTTPKFTPAEDVVSKPVTRPDMPSKAHRQAHSSATHTGSKTARAGHSRAMPSSMFVPPPPPTPYTLPSGIPVPFDQLESLNPTAKPAKTAKAAPKIIVPVMFSMPDPAPAATPTRVDQRKMDRGTPLQVPAAPVTPTQQVEWQSPPNANESSAPAPGADSVQLERIVLPAQ